VTTLDGQTTRLDPSAHARVRGQGRRGALMRSNLTGWLMIAPMVILLAIFVIYPLLYSFYLSTWELSFYLPAEFVGLDFYGYVLDSPRFWNALWVGIRLALIVVPLSLLIAFLLASFIKAVGGRLAGVLKTTIYIPTVISAVVARSCSSSCTGRRAGSSTACCRAWTSARSRSCRTPTWSCRRWPFPRSGWASASRP
jgi:ABC-type Fe3+ transport system permease subunit